MHKLVLLRHDESTWNLENRFTGWTDVDLSPKGVEEAHAAARLLREGGYVFDVAHTSGLKRKVLGFGGISRARRMTAENEQKHLVRCPV